jgi:hypothetical protein
LGIGFESVVINTVAGIFSGLLVIFYSLFTPLFPSLFQTNIILFVVYGIPLTGSTHYTPRLGLLSALTIIFTIRLGQFFLGILPFNNESYFLIFLWSIISIILIGYLPGKIISTSENFRDLFKGMIKVALVYSSLEYIIYSNFSEATILGSTILLFPLVSFPLFVIVTTLSAYAFTNILCPYMMIPLIARTVKGYRYCGSGNFVFKVNQKLEMDNAKIKKASKRGFRLISKLPTVTVFSCPKGGLISVYNSGNILIRKVNKSTAEQINKHLTPIIEG